MGLTRMTALTLKNNKDVEVMVDGPNENNKYSGSIYVMHNGEIHSLLVSTQPVFDTEKAVKESLTNLIEECKNSKEL